MIFYQEPFFDEQFETVGPPFTWRTAWRWRPASPKDAPGKSSPFRTLEASCFEHDPEAYRFLYDAEQGPGAYTEQWLVCDLILRLTRQLNATCVVLPSGWHGHDDLIEDLTDDGIPCTEVNVTPHIADPRAQGSIGVHLSTPASWEPHVLVRIRSAWDLSRMWLHSQHGEIIRFPWFLVEENHLDAFVRILSAGWQPALDVCLGAGALYEGCHPPQERPPDVLCFETLRPDVWAALRQTIAGANVCIRQLGDQAQTDPLEVTNYFARLFAHPRRAL